MFLSKSSYCKGAQCEKMLWLEKYRKDSLGDEGSAVFEKGREVGELAKGLFGDYEDVSVDEDINLRVKNTDLLLKKAPNIITEASFIYQDNFCSVDILKNDSNGVEIYEVKSTTKLDKINMDDPSYQYFVLSSLGLNVKRVCVVFLNREYVRHGPLDMGELFKIEDVTDVALQKQDEIKNTIDFLNGYMNGHGEENEPVKDISENCFKPHSCSFWDYCTKDLPKPNVFDISGMFTSKKFEKYHEGKISFKDLANENLNPKYLEQIDFELNDRDVKINAESIREFLDSLRYPLYFIDYEACQYAIPEYDLTRPYQQIPFQYSLHIIPEKGASLEHREFLARIDDENIIRTFAESMIGDISENGSVIVYNRTFEESHVNKKIAEMYPDLAGEIERINGNIVDLMVPFKNRQYYKKEMEGSYSIKYVLPALYPDDPGLDYHNLDLIHKGDEASNAFLSLKDKTPSEQEKIRKALFEYCKLDTYAMVKIWEKFTQAV